MHVTLFLNHTCNLDCAYCYNGTKFDRPLSMPLIRKAIDLAFTSGDVRISFFGGEPLLEFERIKEAVTYARQREAELNRKMLRFSMTVNGTRLNDDILQYCRDENFFVAVSLDGIAEANNVNRRFADGTAAYDSIVSGIELVKKYYGKVATSAVIHPGNVCWLGDSFSHIIELGVSRFSFNFDYDAGWSDAALSTYRTQMKEVTHHYINAYRAGNAVDYTSFTSKINGHLNGGLNSKCLFGNGEITVAPSGRLYPCERLVREDDDTGLSIGDIDSGIDLEKVLAFKRLRYTMDADCAACQVESRCLHTCGCMHFATTGTIGNVSSLVCDVEQTVIRAADEAAGTLYAERNPAFLKRFYRLDTA